MIKEERRQYRRKTLNPLPHVHLPSGNGGIVLDVSEQGLRFRATSPVDQSGPIVFSFTSHSNLVAGMGEVVWTDRTKKMGALRFTELPYNALQQIRKWPENLSLRPSIGQDLTLHIAAPDEPESARSSRSGVRAAFSSAIERILPETARSKMRGRWYPALGNSAAESHAISPEARFREDDRRLIKVTFALFLGIVLSTVAYARHRQAGEMLVRLGTKLSGEITTSASASTTAPAEPGVDTRPVGTQDIEAPLTQPVPQAATSAPDKTVDETSTPTPAPPVHEIPVRPAKVSASGARLVVQVAALKEEVEARKLTDKLRQENFQAFVGTLPVDSLYRVMLGPYPDPSSARVVLGQLKRAGFNSFIRRESAAERQGS